LKPLVFTPRLSVFAWLQQVVSNLAYRARFSREPSSLAFEFDQLRICPADIARPAGACSNSGRGPDHRPDHFGVLAHAQVIIGAPDHDFLRALRRMSDSGRKSLGDLFDLGEHPITALVPQRHERFGEEVVKYHEVASSNGQCGIEPAALN